KPGNILLSVGGAARPSAANKVDDKARKDDSKKDGRVSNAPAPAHAAPKITDFGLAKRVEKQSDWSSESDPPAASEERHTRTGAGMGTPSYIAPEQAAGKNRDVGMPADIYSLGAILYELLTGRPPFRGETPLDTVLQVMSDEPVPPRSLQPKLP